MIFSATQSTLLQGFSRLQILKIFAFLSKYSIKYTIKSNFPLEEVEEADLKNVSYQTKVYSISLPWTGQQTRFDSIEKHPSAVQLKSDTASKVFDCLVDSFIEDYVAKKYVADKSGWRILTGPEEAFLRSKHYVVYRKPIYGRFLEKWVVRSSYSQQHNFLP